MGEDLQNEGTQAVEMESFGSERDARVGADGDLGGCDGCKPGATQVFGKRAIGLPAGVLGANGVVAGAPVTYKIAPICDTKLECLFVPTAQAPNFMVTSLKYQNTEMVAEANSTVEGAGAASVDGVPLSEFLPFGTCANLLRGICVKANIPVTIVVVNITNALAELSIGLKGTST